jgi:putative molybdopterin biosynthesis protein
VVIGSHDPLLDIIADLVRRKYHDKYVSSAHVGSMGGIMAIKRGEAHTAGIHLLDEETGEYNISYIKKYLGDEKILLIQGVRRVQGLMLAANNPKNIKGLGDIARDGLKYVNRQKGSGTRILLDYLLRKDNISADDIYGYEREEFTHMSVATLIASGSADVGMGIYSAAKIYGLDFIPVCEEQYDFIMPARFVELEIVRHFIQTLKSEEFKLELNQMGGYKVENSGELQIIDPS